MLSQHEADTLAEARKIVRDLYYVAHNDSDESPLMQYKLGMCAAKCEVAGDALTALLILISVSFEDAKARDVLGAG